MIIQLDDIAIAPSDGLGLNNYLGAWSATASYTTTRPVGGTQPPTYFMPIVSYNNKLYIPNGTKEPTIGETPDLDSAWSIFAIQTSGSPSDLQVKTITIPSLSASQTVNVTWNTPLSSVPTNINISYYSSDDALLSFILKNGTLTTTGVSYIVNNISQLQTVTDITINFQV